MITISVTTLYAKPVAQPLAALFGRAGGTIGRSPENTLVLLDPDRKISRTHATVVFRDGSFALRDHGSVTPVILNGQPIGNGNERPLVGGDELRIGPYVLAVAGSAANDDDAPAQQAPHAEPVVSWQAEAPAAAPGEGITTVIVSAPEGEPTPIPPERAAASTPDAAAPSSSLQAEKPAAASAPSAQAAQPIAKDSVPATATAAPSASTDELLRALLAGAGLRDVEIPGGLTPEVMHKLGQLLNEATRGLLDLLAARASAKRNVRADMTVIVSSDNNPLKFSPNLEAALTHLLVPKGRGFMPPLRAVADAYEDLRTHQVGFMAGMRSALAVVLARFDPRHLEEGFASSIADSFLAGPRKAKLWDQFTQLYGQISADAESDFHTLFGQEFLKAYREHAVKPPAGADPPKH